MSFKRFRNFTRTVDDKFKFEVPFAQVVKQTKLSTITKPKLLELMFRDSEAFIVYMMYRAYMRLEHDEEGFVSLEELQTKTHELVQELIKGTLAFDIDFEETPIDEVSDEQPTPYVTEGELSDGNPVEAVH